MLGIVSELQKHHIKFTMLLASDPLDQLFLASIFAKPMRKAVSSSPPPICFSQERATLFCAACLL